MKIVPLTRLDTDALPLSRSSQTTRRQYTGPPLPCPTPPGSSSLRSAWRAGTGSNLASKLTDQIGKLIDPPECSCRAQLVPFGLGG